MNAPPIMGLYLLLAEALVFPYDKTEGGGGGLNCPVTAPIPQTSPVKAIYSGLSFGVVVTDSILITPAYRLTPPIPANARPKMSTSIIFAAPLPLPEFY